MKKKTSLDAETYAIFEKWHLNNTLRPRKIVMGAVCSGYEYWIFYRIRIYIDPKLKFLFIQIQNLFQTFFIGFGISNKGFITIYEIVITKYYFENGFILFNSHCYSNTVQWFRCMYSKERCGTPLLLRYSIYSLCWIQTRIVYLKENGYFPVKYFIAHIQMRRKWAINIDRRVLLFIKSRFWF